MSYRLSLANVKAAAKKAYEENRLTAQNDGNCRYKQFLNGKDCVCAIGAAIEHLNLNYQEKHTIDGVEMEINSICVKELPKVSEILLPINKDELKKIISIQDAHDNWCIKKTESAKEEFLSLIYK